MRVKQSERTKEKRFKRFDRLLSCLHIFFVGFAAALVIYLFFIMVIDTGKYRVRAQNQRAGRTF